MLSPMLRQDPGVKVIALTGTLRGPTVAHLILVRSVDPVGVVIPRSSGQDRAHHRDDDV